MNFLKSFMMVMAISVIIHPLNAMSAKQTQDYANLVEEWTHKDPIPAFELQDQTGETFSMAKLDGHYTLVGLIFTRCAVKEACPLTTQKMRQTQQAWEKAAREAKLDGDKFYLLTLTFDPEFDKPDVLRNYAQRFNANLTNWTFATGPTELMKNHLPSMFNVVAFPSPGAIISHNVRSVLLGPDRKPIKAWHDNAFGVQEVIELVKEDMKKRSS